MNKPEVTDNADNSPPKEPRKPATPETALEFLAAEAQALGWNN